MSNHTFRLYAHIVPVRGAVKFVLYDLQRGDIIYIPEGMYSVLTEHVRSVLVDVLAEYEEELHSIIREYYDWLVDNELGFWTQTPERFPDIDFTYESPERINNAIVDVGAESNHNWRAIFGELHFLGCKHLELRWYVPATLADVQQVLQYGLGGSIRHISLYLPYNASWSIHDLQSAILEPFPVVGSLIVHGYPESHEQPNLDRVYFVPQALTSEQCCGNIGMANLSINIPTYAEALQFNTCLHKKVSIDQYGEVKNCPSMPNGFGGYGGVTLREVVALPAFCEVWAVTKDSTLECKDCELRYACTDCRAYVQEPENPLSKPAKCTYDPYHAG